MAGKNQGINPTEPWRDFARARQERRPFNSSQPRLISRILKRALDIIIAASFLFFLSPLLLSAAVIVTLSDWGPVFNSHRKIGYKGKEFGCLKFRTTGSGTTTDAHVTVVGDILRRSSLDKLPQLINVLLGQMSLVGPRAITKEELPRYGEHAYAYMAVRPGLTGHWQTSGHNDVSYPNGISLDVEYLSKWTLRLDFVIMAKTLSALLSRHALLPKVDS
ncbi:sugar transferase [Rhizobium leguminosarum bv. viciae]|uniref:sugar transferase n=1 Tax=Rhizobium leguminosarum TaxID=384 RepID=UPI000360B205|nr:sugar transferase [Rhizobium leguminosarum]ASR09366.1 sugar transferase [Rhizobium leguminosarum bv. viciae]MBY5753792.1 sugar transferase [Rhizobium leguminosarum]MBY5773208.1 sugar transferase [Rhizobium leguminosarum]MBY5800366.1 sugar transferase [Rhizobium leguminosarum]NKL99633.1 sugar transferase [Rhizobium leguminosarum bv. viciae]